MIVVKIKYIQTFLTVDISIVLIQMPGCYDDTRNK
jgi:hypothetical protein